MAAPGLRINYEFQYRGAAEQWSQLYHLDDDFADRADFLDVCTDFVIAVAPALPAANLFRMMYGYQDTDNDATYSVDATPNGGGSWTPGTGDVPTPGDCAVWTRWDTERRTSTGRKIYLRKYWHGCYADSTAAIDVIAPTLKTALETFASDATGTGWAGKHLAGPDGLVPGGDSAASSVIGFRQLKRR